MHESSVTFPLVMIGFRKGFHPNGLAICPDQFRFELLWFPQRAAFVIPHRRIALAFCELHLHAAYEVITLVEFKSQIPFGSAQEVVVERGDLELAVQSPDHHVRGVFKNGF